MVSTITMDYALIMFAIIAAFSLMAALVVAEPIIPQAVAQGNNGQDHIKTCGANPNAQLNAQVCL